MIDCSMLKWRQLAPAHDPQTNPSRFTDLLEGAFLAAEFQKAKQNMMQIRIYEIFSQMTYFIRRQMPISSWSKRRKSTEHRQRVKWKWTKFFADLTWIGWNWLPIRWVPNNSNQFCAIIKDFSKFQKQPTTITTGQRWREGQKNRKKVLKQ